VAGSTTTASATANSYDGTTTPSSSDGAR
jgi:hypothetical protein